MATFLASAGKKTTDIRGFLREAAGNNSIKYRPEKGVKHYLHIPCVQVPVQDENGNTVMQNQIVAITGSVHEWQSSDGKYKATICLKDVIRKSEDGTTFINDGSCPFCDKVGDAWDIYRYRHDTEEKTCGKVGEDLEKHLGNLKKTFADERKAKEARPYIYLLVVKYRTDAKGQPVIGQNGLPEYDLKVMKLSDSRVEKLQQQIENSGDVLPGCEIIFEYPNEDDARLIVSQSTTAPVFPNARFINKYTGLLAAIQSDVNKFSWEGIEKSFQEWQGMTSAEAEKTVTGLFEKWDEYKKELTVNPNAKYLEYLTSPTTKNPALGAGQSTMPSMAPGIPGAAPVVPGAAPVVPGATSISGNSIPDANSMFGAPQAPSVNI